MPVTQIVKEYPEIGNQEIFSLLTSIQSMLGKNNQNSQTKTYAGENGQSNFKTKLWDKKNQNKYNGRQKYEERSNQGNPKLSNDPKPEFVKRQSVRFKGRKSTAREDKLQKQQSIK